MSSKEIPVLDPRPLRVKYAVNMHEAGALTGASWDQLDRSCRGVGDLPKLDHFLMGRRRMFTQEQLRAWIGSFPAITKSEEVD